MKKAHLPAALLLIAVLAFGSSGAALGAITNLALTGTATQSTLWTPSQTADLAIDDNPATYNHTRDDVYPYAWWQVDLGNVYSISQIDIINRPHDTGNWDGRINPSTITIINNGTVTWTGHITTDASSYSWSFTPVLGQIARIQLDARDYLHMAEFRVWGESAPVPLPAAVWLFGAGLLGLVGIRRKMK